MLRISSVGLCFGLLAALSAGPAQAVLVDGQSIGIDFSDGGNTGGSGSEVNFVIVNGDIADLATIDTTGGSTGGVLVDIFNAGADSDAAPNPAAEMGENNLGFGQGGNAGTGNYGSFPFSDLSFNDGIFANSNRQDVPVEDGKLTVTFKGLDNALSYDLLAIVNGGTTRTNMSPVTIAADGLSLEGQTGAATSGGTQDGTLIPSLLSGLGTDGAGNLEITFTASTEGDDDEFYGLGALHLTAVVGGTLPGDVNGDNMVTVADYEDIRDNFRLTGATRSQGDLTGPGGNRDFVVDFYDFIEWQENFPTPGAGALAGLDSAAIPEPGSASLFVLSVVSGVLVASRRRL